MSKDFLREKIRQWFKETTRETVIEGRHGIKRIVITEEVSTIPLILDRDLVLGGGRNGDQKKR